MTGFAGGIAANVVPDRATVPPQPALPRRTAAPQKRRRTSARWLGAADADEVAITGNSRAAPVVADTPLVERLRRRRRPRRAPKQAWTPVAEFADVGVDAVNFGPGATAYAHTRDEQVEIAALVAVVRGAARLRDRYRLAVVRLSPVLAAQATYPFVRLDEAKRRAVERGVEVIDFGIGDPREPTDPRDRARARRRAAAHAGLPARAGAPRAPRGDRRLGTSRRFGVELDAEREIVPTFGSKEAIFTLRPAPRRPGGGTRHRARDRARLPGARSAAASSPRRRCSRCR